MTNEEKFREWLKSDKSSLVLPNGESAEIYIKAPRTEQFDYLYRQSTYNSTGLQRNNSLEYIGIYNKSDDTVYDYMNYYTSVKPANIYAYSVGDMRQKMIEAVQKRVESRIDNNRNNLTIDKLSPKVQEAYNRFKSNYSDSEIRCRFLSGEESSGVSYNCDYNFQHWTDNGLLEYIADPEEFVQREVQKYLSENQEEILLQFKENDLIITGLQELEEKEDSELHRLRNIMQIMSATPAKTVTVTINKDGQEFTFKTEARDLRRDPNGSYSCWSINAKDRREFEELFGRYVYGYKPEEITDISYCGKSIYSAEPLEEQTEVQEMKLT